jgi:NACalpha-BTF3-like transcription factor
MNELQRLLQGKLLQEQEGMSEERGIISPKMDSIDPSNYEEQSTTNTQLDAMIPSRPEEAPTSIDHSEPVQPEVEEVAPQRELSPTEILREQLEKVRSQSKSEEEEARKNAMWSNVLQTLGTIGQAQIQRGAKTQVGITPGKMVSAQEAIAPVRSERNAQLKALMDEYKMLQGQAPKALTDLDKAKIESEKARAAKFLADAKKTPMEDPLKREALELRKEQVAMKKAEKAQELESQLMTTQDSLNKIRSVKDSLVNPKTGKIREGLIGPIDTTLHRTLGALRGTKEYNVLKNLDDIMVDQTLLKTAKTKGAISDREMALFEKGLPSTFSDEKSIYNWLDQIEKVNKKIEKFYQKELQPTTGTSTDNKKEFSESQEKGIERVMKANNISRDQAINALKKAGKL